MSQHVEAEAFDSVLHHWDDKHQLVFVEQIDFPINSSAPAETFHCLFSSARNYRAARAAESREGSAGRFSGDAIRGAPNAEAGVYTWRRAGGAS